MKSKCCLWLTRCWANGSFSSSLVNRRFWTCNTAKPLTVPRFRARGNYPSHRKAACPWWHEKELLHCCKRRKIQTVLEFFAVGDSPTAVLFRTVKGGGKLPQHKISTVFKVHLSLFSLARFFIGHLTLSFLKIHCLCICMFDDNCVCNARHRHSFIERHRWKQCACRHEQYPF